MKIVYKIMVFALLLTSCQSDNKQVSSLKATGDKQAKSEENSNTNSKDLKSNTILTEAQFKDFFPMQIGDYKRINVSVEKFSGSASATYIKNNDYNLNMTFYVQDGDIKGSGIIRNFKDSYKVQPQGPHGTEYIYTERDGYKTIAFLQPKINRNDVRFIYNNRFGIVMEGAETVETLWSYIKKEDLQKLDNY
jgi:hypothetical protein